MKTKLQISNNQDSTVVMTDDEIATLVQELDVEEIRRAVFKMFDVQTGLDT